MTMPDRAQLVRTAASIQRQLASSAPATDLAGLPVAAWERCRQLAQLADRCHTAGWTAAERECQHRLRRALDELARQLETMTERLRRPQTSYRPSLGELYADLVSLGVEFQGLSIDLGHSLLSVTTESIVLEGLDLGRFQIELDWSRLRRGASTYAVIALDPNPAGSNSDITHPHVNDERLCEGEAFGSIRAALASGRLLDFFTIVAQTLATYNLGSAFVDLDRWSGTSCTDCGCSTDEDDRTSCERCECDLCCECSCGCSQCSRYICQDCSMSCTECSENHCRTCLAECRTCRNHYCERCLNDEQCPQCRDAAATADPSPAEEEIAAGEAPTGPPPAPAAAGAARDPVCVGEAGVSA
jgi:hypothetical protein